MAREVSKLSVLLLFNTEKFDQQLSNVQKRMRRSGRMMQEVGKTMTIGLSVPLAIIGKRMTETATEFEYQMARVQAISGAAGKAFQNLQGNAEALGASTIYTAREVGQLQEEFAKLGFSASEITQVTESTLSLAQVTGADLARAAEVAGSTLRIFGMDATNLGQANDVVATAISRSALDFESFAETMKYAGSQAAISGVSMEELSAAMGVLANRGVKGSIAGTRLRMIFAKLAEEGGDVHENFLELINGSMTMAEAIDRFGVRAATAVPVLQENREEFYMLEKQMRFSAGTLQTMQERMDDTSFAAQKKLKSALEDVSIQFGKALLPLVNAAANLFVKLANVIAAIPTPVKAMLVAVGGLLTILGPLIYALGTLKIAFVSLQFMAPGLAAAFSTMLGPVGLIVTAVAGLGAYLYAASQESDGFADAAERIADANAEAASEVGKVLTPIRKLIAEYGNENTEMDRKAQILRELGEMQPEYFKDLDAEKTKVGNLKDIYKQLETNVLAAAKARAYQTQLTKLSEQEAELVGKQIEEELNIDELQRQRATPEGAPRRVAKYESTGMGGMALVGYETFDPLGDKIEMARNRIKGYQADIDSLAPYYEAIQARIDALGVDPTAGTTGTGATTGGGGGGGEDEKMTKVEKAMLNLKKAMAVITAEAETLNKEGIDVTTARISALQRAFKSLVEAGVEGEDLGNNLTNVTTQLQELKGNLLTQEEAKQVQDAMSGMVEASTAMNASLDLGLIDNLGGLQAQAQYLGSALDTLIPILGTQDELVQSLAASYRSVTEEIEKMNNASEETTDTTNQAVGVQQQMIGIVQQFGNTLGSAAGKSKSFGAAVAQGIKEAVVATLQLAFAQHVQNALNPANAVNISTAGLGGLAIAAAGVGILTGIINSINIPELASGGIAVGSQLAVVGDNRSGREAIIPLERLPGIIEKMGGGQGGRVLYGNLRGTDIHVSSNRGARTKQRIL